MKDTIIERIIELIKSKPLTISEILNELELDRKSKRNVIELMNKIERISKQKGWKLIIYPAQCKKCGFTFKEKIKPPSKCPRCKSQWISEQRFFLKV